MTDFFITEIVPALQAIGYLGAAALLCIIVFNNTR
jgi:hypothetical protein